LGILWKRILKKSGSVWKYPADLSRNKQEFREVNWPPGRKLKPNLTQYKEVVLLTGYQPPVYSASVIVAAFSTIDYTSYCAAYLARMFNLGERTRET
jgi:hypothetical protein